MMKLRNLTEREKLGYRDGVEEGKNSSVQEGFDEGYREAAIAGFNWGVARGITSAFAALPASLKEKLQ
jgi:flagellar biosynthesis/type III secretory pathway protein FliH